MMIIVFTGTVEWLQVLQAIFCLHITLYQLKKLIGQDLQTMAFIGVIAGVAGLCPFHDWRKEAKLDHPETLKVFLNKSSSEGTVSQS